VLIVGVLGLASAVVAIGAIGAACSEGGGCSGRCEVGTDPMPSVSVTGAGWRSSFPPELVGDVEVRDVLSRVEGGYTFTLHFVEEATDLEVTLAIPGDPALPFAEGDTLWGRATYHAPWWTEVTLELKTLEGTRLLDYADGELRPSERPPRCHRDPSCDAFIGLVPITVDQTGCTGRPDAAGLVVYEGETAVMRCGEGDYAFHVIAAHAYAIDPDEELLSCSDVPRGWRTWLWHRVPEGWTAP
jgi:hypothetical protein